LIMLGLGDTVMLPKPGHEKEHLWAPITAPDPETGDAIMVNLTTQRPHSDTTAIIQPGEHPFVDRPNRRASHTSRAFPRSRKAAVTHLNKSMPNGMISSISTPRIRSFPA